MWEIYATIFSMLDKTSLSSYIVLVAVVSYSGFRTKKWLRAEPFPAHLPRGDKIASKSVRTLHEESRLESLKVSICSLLVAKCRPTCCVLSAGWYANRR